jgi:uncharacterized protein (TIGR02145 family)
VICRSAAASASVTAFAAPVISSQPAGIAICASNTATLSVTASPVTAYQWKKNGEDATGTSASYDTEALTTTTTYSVVVSHGDCSVTSDNAVVSMKTEGCCTLPGSTVNFTAFNPCSNAATGAVWYLTDMRLGGNNNTYKVKKMPDGHIWMVQDLKFGTCPNSAANWYSDESAAATTHTPTVYAGYVGHCRSSTYTNAGYLYNWPAVMQNTDAYYSSTVSSFGCSGTESGTALPNPGACQGICPAGWHVPTAYSDGEYRALDEAMKNAFSCSPDCWHDSNYWGGVLAGYADHAGNLVSPGTRAFYTSSRYGHAYNPWVLDLLETYTEPYIRGYSKGYGMSLRCVKNY